MIPSHLVAIEGRARLKRLAVLEPYESSLAHAELILRLRRPLSRLSLLYASPSTRRVSGFTTRASSTSSSTSSTPRAGTDHPHSARRSSND